jgi:hypothetical protein
MAPVLFIMFTEAGRAADLTESYTFKQSDGSEYTTTFVIKEKGSGLGSTVTGSVNWGHKQNNQDSPDGKLENADWVVEKAERKDLGESEPATQIVWTIIGKRKDDPQAEGTIVINCPTKLGEDKHINRVIIYGGSLGAGKLPIFSIEESEQTAALKALEELGMIDKQPQYSPEVDDLKGKIWEAELAQRNFAAGLPHCNELNGTIFISMGAIAFSTCKIIVARSTIWSRRERLIQKPDVPGINRTLTPDGHRCKNRRTPTRPTARRSLACRSSGKN